LTLIGEDNQIILGNKVADRNLATRQSHLMTIDKTVFEMNMSDVFKK